jgi:hypothetical protein
VKGIFAMSESLPTEGRYGDQFNGGCCELVAKGIPCTGYAAQADRIKQLDHIISELHKRPGYHQCAGVCPAYGYQKDRADAAEAELQRLRSPGGAGVGQCAVCGGPSWDDCEHAACPQKTHSPEPSDDLPELSKSDIFNAGARLAERLHKADRAAEALLLTLVDRLGVDAYWEMEPETDGKISQIDNLIAGLLAKSSGEPSNEHGRDKP